MSLRVAAEMDFVEVFEARLVDERGEIVAHVHGSSMPSARAMALAINAEYTLGASAIQVGAQPVLRFRYAVTDEQGRWMHLAYGATPQEARGQAEFWLTRESDVLH